MSVQTINFEINHPSRASRFYLIVFPPAFPPTPPNTRAVMWLNHVKLWDWLSLKNLVKSPFFKNCHRNIICEPAAQNFTSPIGSFPEWKLGLLLKPCIDLIQKQDKQTTSTPPLAYNSSLGVLTVQPIIIIIIKKKFSNHCMERLYDWSNKPPISMLATARPIKKHSSASMPTVWSKKKEKRSCS